MGALRGRWAGRRRRRESLESDASSLVVSGWRGSLNGIEALKKMRASRCVR